MKDKTEVERRPVVCSPILSLNLSLLVSFSLLFASGLVTEVVSPSDYAWAESPTSQAAAQLKGNIMRGREIFNGKGVCYYCHGIDGYIGRPPRLAADTAALIA
ncbi:MAG TPA: hypothetical protein VN039_05195, partial [Nitrospira sp.]|nr:hypothetical protein [Nitrospira sp.]